MKIFFMIVLSALICSNAIAQNTTVTIQLKGMQEPEATVILPVNENYFWLNEKKYPIGTDSTIVIKLQTTNAVILRCQGYYLIVEPGKTFAILDFTQPQGKALQYLNKNWEGLLVYNNSKEIFYQYAAAGYYKKDSTLTGVKHLVETDIKNAMRPYDSLLKKAAISKKFYSFVKTEMQLRKASILAHVPLEQYFTNRRKLIEPVLADSLSEFWKKVYHDYPVMDIKGLKTRYFYDYAYYYSGTYKQFYLLNAAQQQQLEANIKDAEGAYLEYLYKGITNDFSPPVKEYMEAYFIGYEMYQQRYQPELLKLYKQFVKTYPKSNYIPTLQPLAVQIMQFNEASARPYTPDEIIIDNYESVNTIEALLNEFKGKTVYVDIWATWCGPCKREFEYNNELKLQLKSNGIEILYISMDKPSATEKWKNMIKYYNLAGKHIKANESLGKELISIIGKNGSYAIPRYLIVKDGKIINKNALRPSDKEKLYQQLKSVL